MEFRIHPDVQSFLSTGSRFLGTNEVLNNLPIGVADEIIKGRVFASPPTFVTVHEHQAVAGAALMTPPWPWTLSVMASDVATQLGEYLREQGFAINGVNGPVAVANAFSRGVKRKMVEERRMWILRLDEVIWPSQPIAAESGQTNSIQRATPRDLAFVVEWYQAFSEEVGTGAPEDAARRAVSDNRLYILRVENEPVSMAAFSRELPRGYAVSAVYTPRQFRKNGYASMVTAAVSQVVLDLGKEYVCLFTDASNPTSNKIYEAIGFQRVGESVSLKFL